MSPRATRTASRPRSRSAAPPPPPRRGNPPWLAATAAVAVVVLVAGGVWLAVSRPAPVQPAAAGVTPVALPTFGADAPENVLESNAPEILTPTPGSRPAPAANVVTTGNWQVLVAHSSVPELSSPSGVAVDGDGNLFVVDFEGDFVQKLSPSGQPLARFGQKGNGPGQFAGPTNLALDGQGNVYVA